MSNNKFWSTDKIVSISAMLISILTLVVFVYQTALMRQQQQLSVMPYLAITKGGTNTPDFKIILTNNGIGPAFIESRTITYEGAVYDLDFPNFFNEYIPAFRSLNHVFHSNITQGKMIPPGETVYLFQVNNSQEDADSLLKLWNTSPLQYQITYSSIYKQQWQIKHDQPIPKRIR